MISLRSLLSLVLLLLVALSVCGQDFKITQAPAPKQDTKSAVCADGSCSVASSSSCANGSCSQSSGTYQTRKSGRDGKVGLFGKVFGSRKCKGGSCQ